MNNEYLDTLMSRSDIVVYPIDPSTIRGFEFLRGYCERNTCGQYNRNWMCPPNLPEVQDLNEELRQYSKAFLVQKNYFRKDPFGGEHIIKQDFFDEMSKINVSLEAMDHLVLTTGECKHCKVCKKLLNEPCINKRMALASVESYGIEVNHLMKANKIKRSKCIGEQCLVGLVCVKD